MLSSGHAICQQQQQQHPGSQQQQQEPRQQEHNQCNKTTTMTTMATTATTTTITAAITNANTKTTDSNGYIQQHTATITAHQRRLPELPCGRGDGRATSGEPGAAGAAGTALPVAVCVSSLWCPFLWGSHKTGLITIQNKIGGTGEAPNPKPPSFSLL